MGKILFSQKTQKTCPICNSNLKPYVSRPISAYAKESQFDIYICEGCCCGITIPTLSYEQVASIYEKTYNFDAHSLIASEKRFRARRIISFAMNGPVESLLDVGCMHGYLLQEARRLGISRVEGVEFSEKSTTYARQKGASVFHGTIEQYAANRPGLFDLIIAQHVLEHVFNIGIFLNTVSSLLRPGGLLIMCVPHFGSKSQKWFKRSWGWYQLPVHLIHFSPAALRIISQQYSFKMLKMRFQGGDSLFIMLTLLYWLKRRAGGLMKISTIQKVIIRLASFFLRPYFYIGDEEILVVMQKTR